MQCSFFCQNDGHHNGSPTETNRTHYSQWVLFSADGSPFTNALGGPFLCYDNGTEERKKPIYCVDLALGSVHKRYKMDFRVDSVPKIYIKSADNLHSMHVKGVLLTLFI